MDGRKRHGAVVRVFEEREAGGDITLDPDRFEQTDCVEKAWVDLHILSETVFSKAKKVLENGHMVLHMRLLGFFLEGESQRRHEPSARFSRRNER